jgi:hypothetical protein
MSKNWNQKQRANCLRLALGAKREAVQGNFKGAVNLLVAVRKWSRELPIIARDKAIKEVYGEALDLIPGRNIDQPVESATAGVCMMPSAPCSRSVPLEASTSERAINDERPRVQTIVNGEALDLSYPEWCQFYESYLQSEWWRAFSWQVKACRTVCEAEGCGIDNGESRQRYGQGLNVHHLRYNLNEETEDDVEVLCPYHHQEAHGRSRTKPSGLDVDCRF